MLKAFHDEDGVLDECGVPMERSKRDRSRSMSSSGRKAGSSGRFNKSDLFNYEIAILDAAVHEFLPVAPYFDIELALLSGENGASELVSK